MPQREWFRVAHLVLTVAELQFRYHSRFNANIFGTSIKGC
ncbi:hypothetical protein SAMN05443254_112133 [Bradyrhizobium sp. OK095]|nr:hypothetical protein SAMN05443254_112133 [Bradyrhizobium sp. OK095]